MFSFFKQSTKPPLPATVNGITIDVNPGETLLNAALRANIDFPHSCRVGGCAACKCKLQRGRVRELTDNSYILSDKELEQGYILACQATPITPITVAVGLPSERPHQTIEGKIIAQEPLTHDITLLKAQLSTTLRYKAGQYANLELSALPGIRRSYSFATPPNPDGTVAFFIRKVPNGLFSSTVNEQSLCGQRILIDAPLGNFYLHPAEGPLLMVAGGSGLAPILAILEQALAEKCQRPVHVLFGAREQKDLYAINELDYLQRHWKANFTLTTCLSAEPTQSNWRGAHGLITDHLPRLEADTSAYLCGPPAMIDACEQHLKQLGIPAQQIFCDRFISRQTTTAA